MLQKAISQDWFYTAGELVSTYANMCIFYTGLYFGRTTLRFALIFIHRSTVESLQRVFTLNANKYNYRCNSILKIVAVYIANEPSLLRVQKSIFSQLRGCKPQKEYTFMTQCALFEWTLHHVTSMSYSYREGDREKAGKCGAEMKQSHPIREEKINYIIDELCTVYSNYWTGALRNFLAKA